MLAAVLGAVMRRVLFALLAGAAALAATLPARAADDACHLYRIASVDMGIDAAGRMTVPMTVGGQGLTMLIDTGGLDTMLTDSVVEAQHLVKQRINNVRVVMFGGTNIDTYATAHDIDFGGLKAPKMIVLVVPDGRLPAGIGGILAPDILRAYDDDIDFANARFSLFSTDHCPGDVVYWTKDFAQIDMAIEQTTGHIVVPVTLDGKEIKFTFDTGADYSVLDWDLAKDLFGIDEHSPGVTAVTRNDGRTVYRYAFKELTFGDAVKGAVTVKNPVITLVPSDVSRMHHTVSLLGIGILRQLHLYLAYKEKHLFVTPASAH
jgi:predicted aspartyl protease